MMRSQRQAGSDTSQLPSTMSKLIILLWDAYSFLDWDAEAQEQNLLGMTFC